jgi:hypothetical protein
MVRLLLPLLALMFAALAGPVAASEAGALPALREQQTAVYAIVREFHMQTLLSGDPQRTRQIKAAVDNMRKAAQNLPLKTGNSALDAAVTETRAAVPRFTKLALANNILVDGYTDDNLIGELYTEAELLVAALDKAIKAVPAGKQRAQADKAHAANLLLQRTAAIYLKRGAQMAPDVGSADSFDVAEATQDLDKQIQALARDLRGNDVMANVRSKWNFIRPSLLNYNEKSVPFIVDRYATQINDGLHKLVVELDAK